jgi:hypothetical protein
MTEKDYFESTKQYGKYIYGYLRSNVMDSVDDLISYIKKHNTNDKAVLHVLFNMHAHLDNQTPDEAKKFWKGLLAIETLKSLSKQELEGLESLITNHIKKAIASK